MDAYAFALALGTAGLAAMTVLGFHHGHAPGLVRRRGGSGSSDEVARPPGTGGGRLNVSSAYSNSVIPGNLAVRHDRRERGL